MPHHRPARTSYDTVIIGGAVIGASVAWHLATSPDYSGSILVIERDPSFAQASTALSSSSIRVQFSHPTNVAMSLHAGKVIARWPEEMGTATDKPSLGYHPGGYLFLAETEAQDATLRANHATQRAAGADVSLWSPAQLSAAFPHLITNDIRLASYGNAGEGWFDSAMMMQGYRARARDAGAELLTGEVTALTRSGPRITHVTLASGDVISAGNVVNASGPRAALTARMAGLHIPVEPRKRTSFVFDCATNPEGSATVNAGRLPLMIDPSGIYVRPEGRYFLTGCAPPVDTAVDFDDFEPRHEDFEEIIWPVLAARSTAFEAIKLINCWAGHYAMNTLDHNLVVGPSPEVENFFFANGFSGHGLQQAPAVGRGLAELITHGRYTTLDLSPMGYARIAACSEQMETAVI
ncbi:FAD-binding oxidoreductase [Oceanicola sp. D3]|uniref:NAD(P)/FAD-dependent oxidoreductase n=1 Tax=Oceanicola sp. D3 TaxID=2587163 RepID=UPI001124146E|nr:FAD-binding oxidoreductase [Oceanicola sp. D3]QDC10386.1 FAD-binding oxidoreductase [Oceanicola sp. D3]